MRYSRIFKIVFAVVCLFTALALINCGLHMMIAGMVVYDGNFHAMHELLPKSEAGQIVRTAVNLLFWTVAPLVLSNVCWIALFWFCYARTSAADNRKA